MSAKVLNKMLKESINVATMARALQNGGILVSEHELELIDFTLCHIGEKKVGLACIFESEQDGYEDENEDWVVAYCVDNIFYTLDAEGNLKADFAGCGNPYTYDEAVQEIKKREI